MIQVLTPDDENGEPQGDMHTFPGCRDAALAVESSLSGDSYEGRSRFWFREPSSWLTSERDLPALIAALTVIHPGKELAVFRMEAVHFRVISSEVSSKAVTKDGVLPF